MYGYLKRLVSAGAAYQLSDIVSKLVALGLLPLYTRYLRPADYGVAELLLTSVILVSIVLRFGVGEAFVRFYYSDHDAVRRIRSARTTSGAVLASTTLAALVCLAVAGPLSRLLLGYRDATLLAIAILGLWAFTNLEVAYALLRVDERRRAYATASLINVVLTIAATVVLVVVLHQRARGLLLGNFGASAVVLLGLWWMLRERLGIAPRRICLRDLPAMLRFGLPTVPAEVSVYLLNVIDRFYLFHTRGQGAAAAGLYSLAVKLAAVVVFTVRAFQYAWPPLAYSVSDDDEAARLYSLVATYYVLGTGMIVAAVTLLGRWVIRLFAAPAFHGAYRALPWVALGWALYGLFLVFVVMAGRARVTSRNFPAALAGVVANVVLLVVLVPPLGIAGAGLALCGAYVTIIALMYALTRGLFRVGFQWMRLLRIVVVIGGVTALVEVGVPGHGAVGLVVRVAALLAMLPLLALTGFLEPREWARLRALRRRGRPAPAA